MVLNHVDLQFHDVQAAAEVFVAHFGFTRASNPHSPALVILRGEGGVTLVLQRRRDEQPWPADFHVGFIVPEAAQVHAAHERLVAAGLRCSPVQTNGRGTMTYLHVQDVLVEVSARPANASL